jgi:hypothetical protein
MKNWATEMDRIREMHDCSEPVVGGFSRREVMRGAFLSAAALMARGLSLPAWATATAPVDGKAKAVIQIWMAGGPPHLDSFDPKPGAGSDYSGPLDHPISTNVSGMQISELMPMLAKQADKYSLIRSMTHGIFAHETASYTVQTGRLSGGHDVFPNVGAVVSLFKGYKAGYKGLIPPYIVLTQPQGRFSEAGFLGQQYKPFATGGDPAQPKFAVEGVIVPGITDQRQRDRRDLLHQLDTLGLALKDDPKVAALNSAEKQAYDLILGEAGKVFDLSMEKDALRDQYGRNTFGQSCLVARRLVEHNVPYITINYGGWDTHRQNFPTMRRKLPELDKGLATLLQDLSDRGLLDSTVVWLCGEFGRKPKVDWDAPWNGGRNHWGTSFSALVAGGGFKGGHVIGSTDAHGEEVKSRPVYPLDLIGSVYRQLGIPADARLPHPEGLDVRVLPNASEGLPMAGLLKELV